MAEIAGSLGGRGVEGTWATELLAAATRGCEALAGAFAEEVQLQLGEHAAHPEQGATGRRRGVNPLGQAQELDATQTPSKTSVSNLLSTGW